MTTTDKTKTATTSTTSTTDTDQATTGGTSSQQDPKPENADKEETSTEGGGNGEGDEGGEEGDEGDEGDGEGEGDGDAGDGDDDPGFLFTPLPQADTLIMSVVCKNGKEYRMGAPYADNPKVHDMLKFHHSIYYMHQFTGPDYLEDGFVRVHLAPDELPENMKQFESKLGMTFDIPRKDIEFIMYALPQEDFLTLLEKTRPGIFNRISGGGEAAADPQASPDAAQATPPRS